MKKLSRFLAALIFSVASIVLPLGQAKVFAAAPPDQNGYKIIQFNGVTSLSDVSNATSVSATSANGTATITGTGLYSDGTNTIYTMGDSITVSASPANGYTASILYGGNSIANPANLNLNAGVNIVDLNFSDGNNGGGNGGQPAGNTDASITVSAGAGTYAFEGQERAYDAATDFSINGSMWEPGSATINYNSNGTDTTVDFKFETLWNQRYYDNIVINGVSYNVSDYLNFDDRTAWLVANHGSQLVEFTIPNVAKSNSYNIVVKHGVNNGTRYLATFLWTADPAQAGSHDYIGHSKLEFVRAEYQVSNTSYTVSENDIAGHMTRDGSFQTYRSADGFFSYGIMADVNYDDGNLTLPGGARVTMRVVPEYGYQVTSVNGGNNFTTTDAGVSEFTVVVPDGAAGYFQAEVTAVADQVVSSSEKVSGGQIALANGDIDAGTARLSVNDVDLPADKISDFENQVDSSYKISSYLDINLSKILYRGTEDNVWSEQIHHLRNKALITLQLEEGINGNDIVIIHNIDNGDEFEVIEIESYDPVTNTITFWVSSFSDYAIASRTVASPSTGALNSTGVSFATSTLSMTIFVVTILSAGAWFAFRR